MIPDAALRRERLSALARQGGAFALLALDQRESLRTMLADAGRPTTDDDLRRFKVMAASVLGPLASGMLLDPEYGLDAVLAGAALPKDCGLIVAVDRLDQPRGEPIRSTTFDRSIDLEELTRRGAVALKLLVLWRPAGDPRPTLDLVRGFVEACARAGLVSLVEAVVRDERPWDASRHAATVVAAARELATTEPDVYKAEVPTLGRASLTEIEAAAREVTAALRCPWVVLSNGTSPDAFPDGVRAACRGGASGFLAGRAVWAPAIAGTDRAAHTSEHDLETRLASDAVVRLRTLVEIADSNARPWTAAA